ncbi:NAD(P)/FAD-dependent oxidoreductase [Halolamina salifodinae]|uniref:Threonine dehydrogenase-like Zn-dependent dehydrogenase n=1 Tax=Halolamina salifodinae TaxID=1202767 RepID=A0A8T4GVV0_9EURY|nr:NAD(P)/FAD-dependent oxidoreductase [Halolamina salifodinae]MBP1987029.1 threonine dehydrogenase-like Zn-dependent dehydrogenase [Halolamina salifodinae]
MAQDTRGAFDHDVAIVGGGPAGSSAAVFTARYGLDTVVFDRGRSSIQQCAVLENYLGFPGGIDAGTFYALMHDHVEAAGGAVVSDLVESVERADAGEGFRVEPQSGGSVTARRVIAATRYGGDYLRGLDSEGRGPSGREERSSSGNREPAAPGDSRTESGDSEDAMFESHEYDGETQEYFDKTYADPDGTTPVDGLFIASPYVETSPQAIMAAGQGARVGVGVVEAVRRDRGYPEGVTDYYDWVRREAELDEEWADRDRWREFFDQRLPEDHGLSEERVDELREREVDRRLDMYVSAADADQRAEEGKRRLLEQIDDDLVLEAAREIEADRATNDD